MIRSLFLAVGLYCFLLGLECLVIDKAFLAAGRTSQAFGAATMSRELTPADWAPWSLMSGGAVVMLYTITIPRKLNA